MFRVFCNTILLQFFEQIVQHSMKGLELNIVLVQKVRRYWLAGAVYQIVADNSTYYMSQSVIW